MVAVKPGSLVVDSIVQALPVWVQMTGCNALVAFPLMLTLASWLPSAAGALEQPAMATSRAAAAVNRRFISVDPPLRLARQHTDSRAGAPAKGESSEIGCCWRRRAGCGRYCAERVAFARRRTG